MPLVALLVASTLAWIAAPPASAEPQPQPSPTPEFPDPMPVPESTSVSFDPVLDPPIDPGELPAVPEPLPKIPILPAGTEVVELRTATTKTFATDDPRLMRSVTSLIPVHYLDTDGTWQDIDTALVAVDGLLRNAANSFDLAIAPVASADELVRVDLGAAQSVAWSLEGAHGVPGVLTGSSVRFAEVLPDVDMNLVSTETGVKEMLVLASPSAPREFLFPLTSDGLTPEESDDGGIVFRDAAGDVVATIPQGWMVDSANPEAGGGIESLDVTVELVTEPALAVRLRLSDAWLDAPERVWPITVDPSISHWNFATTNALGDDTYVVNGSPGNRSGLDNLRVGVVTTGSQLTRSFLHFDMSFYEGRNVEEGDLVVYTSFVESCAGTLQVHRVTQSWTGSTATTFPGPATDPTPTATSAMEASCNAFSLDVDSLVVGWNNGTYANNGVMLRMTNESSTSHWKKFYSADNPPSSPRPYMDISWWRNDAPYTPYGHTPNGVEVGSLTPTLSAIFDDPNYSEEGHLEFQVEDVATGVPVVTSGRGTDASTYGSEVYPHESFYTVPSGSLQLARTYRWRARSHDHYTRAPLSSDWSAWVQFTTPDPVPTLTKTKNTAANTFYPGNRVAFDVVVANPSPNAVSVSSLTDTLPGGVRLVSGITADGAACSTCTVSDSVITVSAFTLAGGASRTFRYTLEALADGRGCTAVQNVAQAVTNRGTLTQTVPFAVCETALGLEHWYTTVGDSAGPQGTAAVNVANGNLVVQQLDSTPVPARGRLSFVLRRTYNSQETNILSTAGQGFSPLPQSVGRNWTLAVGELGSLAGLTPSGLVVPSAEAVANPLSLLVVDRDGTRHSFVPRPLATDVNVTAGTTLTGAAATFAPRALQLGGSPTYNRICVDQVYAAPAGVELALWRYVAILGGPVGDPCAPVAATTPVVLGYGALRPDRVRSEYAATGQLLSLVDPAGNELGYQYDNAPAAGVSVGRLRTVFEPGVCASPSDAGCRAMRFTYSDVDGAGVCGPTTGARATCVTDPAGRVTRYNLDSSGRLVRVDNPDGGQVAYRYGTCGGTGDSLCGATDPRGEETTFAHSTPSVGMPQVTTMTDRRGTARQFTYGATTTQVDRGTQRAFFSGIDRFARVGQVLEGSTGNQWFHQTTLTWDTDAAGCQQPAGSRDNRLCRQVRESFTSATPDDDTSFAYSPLGDVLVERHANSAGDEITTYGYRIQQYATDGMTVTEDRVAGDGTVNSGVRRPADVVLFEVSDRIEQLTPRGNVNGATVADFRTTWLVDANQNVAPAQRPGSDPCANPASASSNTGETCEQQAPSPSGTGSALTRYRYDIFGQRTEMRTPNAVAAGTPAYRYVYYQPSERDLTGAVGAAGWLKAVIDPTGRFVAFAYDRAGNVHRSWDRNATATAQPPDAAIAGYPASAPGGYSETIWSSTSAPWRYPTAECNQLAECTRYTLDRNGNAEQVRPPRGSAAGNDTFDIVQTFDAGDLLRTTATPAARAAGRVLEHRYDVFGNRTATLDANANVQTWVYDAVNRPIQRRWTRGPVVTLFPGETCSVTTSGSDAPLPASRRLCVETTSYDGVDNSIATQDANAQTTTRTFDARHRVVRQDTPRNTGGLTTARTEMGYDLDGNLVSNCRPRQFTEGTGGCTGAARFAEHRTYQPAGTLATTVTYRDTTGAALTTTYGYDRNGNQTTLTDANEHTTTHMYDVLDRVIATTTPRAAGQTNTTTRQYDAAGNVTAVIRPGGVADSTGADGDLVVDGAQNPQSNPFVIPAGRQYNDVTLTNGAWIAGATHNASTGTGGVLDLHAAGTVTICTTCGVTMVGRGPAGGAGAGPGNVALGQPGRGHSPGGGGSSATTTGAGGGGGGHLGSGGTGSASAFGSRPAGTGGAPYGNPELSGSVDTLMGSGGGGGGASPAQAGGAGGAGGGHIRIVADKITANGGVIAAGTNGVGPFPTVGGGGGGGGSGGTIWLTASEVFLVEDNLNVDGSVGGAGTSGNNGGGGAHGRIRIDAGHLTGPGATSTQAAGAHRTRVGLTTAYTYDAAHRVVDTVTGADNVNASTAGVATGGANTRTRVQYDADGHVVARYGPRAFTTSTTAPDDRFVERLTYDTTGRLTARHQPRADTATPGLPAQPSECATGVAGFPATVRVCATQMSYDAGDRLTQVTLPTAGTNTNRRVDYGYTDDNLLATVGAPAPSGTGRVTAADHRYDGVGRRVRTVDALGHAVATSYSSDGLVTRVEGQAGPTGTHVTTYVHDADANQTSTTDPVGQAWTTTYTVDNRVADRRDPLTNRTSYTYDNVGNPLTVGSPSANASAANNTAGEPVRHTYTHDNLLATTREPVNPDATRFRLTTNGYDSPGRKTSVRVDETNAAGSVVEAGGTQRFAYLTNDRQASETGRGGESIATTYDAAGNPTAIMDSTSGGSTVAATWYLDNLPLAVTEGSGAVSYAYDGAGRLASRQHDGGTDTFTYNDHGLPTAQSSPAGNWTWAYDNAARPAQQTAPNGTQSASTWNDDDTLATRVVRNSGGTALATHGYGYDRAYRITSQTFSGGAGAGGTLDTATYNYGYDSAGRLTTAPSGATGAPVTITWDPDGNRTAAGTDTYGYNPDGTIRSATIAGNARTFDYDALGLLATDGCTTWTHDGFDRATQAVVASGTGCGTAGTTTWTHDGLDRQRSTTSSGITTQFRHDGLGSALLGEVTPTNPLTYTLDPTGTLVALNRADVGTQHLHDDGHGNTATITTGSATIACTARYDAWGTPRNTHAGGGGTCNTGASPNTTWYRSGRRDPGTGTYQWGSRTYNPTTATWLQPDTYRNGPAEQNLSIGTDPLTANRYSYVNGNPINLADPTGHYACTTRRNAPDGGCGYGEFRHIKPADGTRNRRGGVMTRGEYRLHYNAAGFVYHVDSRVPGGPGLDSWDTHGETNEWRNQHGTSVDKAYRRYERGCNASALGDCAAALSIASGGTAEEADRLFEYLLAVDRDTYGDWGLAVPDAVLNDVMATVVTGGLGKLGHAAIRAASARLAGGSSVLDDLVGAVDRAVVSQGVGSGAVYGTRVHTALRSEVLALGRSDLHSEVSYLRGQVVGYGTPGSVRLDAVIGHPSAPMAIYDLKTGSALLTPSRIAEIRMHLPPGFQDVPVLEIRPG